MILRHDTTTSYTPTTTLTQDCIPSLPHLIVPGAEFKGFVAPIIVRLYLMMPRPSQTF